MDTLRRFFCKSIWECDCSDEDEELSLVCEVEPGYKRTWYRIKAWLRL